MSFRASGNSDISIIYLSESVAGSERPIFSSPGLLLFSNWAEFGRAKLLLSRRARRRLPERLAWQRISPSAHKLQQSKAKYRQKPRLQYEVRRFRSRSERAFGWFLLRSDGQQIPMNEQR